MEFNKEDKTIEINRGSEGTLRIKNTKGSFSIGDKLKFSIVEVDNYKNVFFQKEYEITEESEYAHIILEPDDTRFVDVISEEQTYWYEIELNDRIPLIAYDKEKGKKFILYPEAPNQNEVNNNG